MASELLTSPLKLVASLAIIFKLADPGDRYTILYELTDKQLVKEYDSFLRFMEQL